MFMWPIINRDVLQNCNTFIAIQNVLQTRRQHIFLKDYEKQKFNLFFLGQFNVPDLIFLMRVVSLKSSEIVESATLSQHILYSVICIQISKIRKKCFVVVEEYA